MKALDLTEKRFGRLIAVSRAENMQGKTAWKCICDCGNYTTVATTSLRTGNAQSCGCYRSDFMREKMSKCEVGQRYGRLIVMEEADMRVQACEHPRRMFLCQCDCGTVAIIESASLLSGNTRSCGCLKAELDSEKLKTHGLSMVGGKKRRLYSIWIAMKSRCSNDKNKDFPYYGGRGISICSEWQSSFEAFYAWALKTGYDETAAYGKCTIDRIDVNGPYSPRNCRWVDAKAQANNRR